MNIDNQLPPDVERAIRNLKNDKIFFDAVWTALQGYTDFRAIASLSVPKADSKKMIDRVMTALANLRQAKALVTFVNDRQGDTALDEMEALYTAVADHLDNRPRKKNWAIQWVAERLTMIFIRDGIPPQRLSGFMVKVIPLIEENAPSERTIKSAISSAKSAIQP